MSRFESIGVAVGTVAAIALGYAGYRWVTSDVDVSPAVREEVKLRRLGDGASSRDSVRIRGGGSARPEGFDRHTRSEELKEQARAARRERLENRENSELIGEIAEMLGQEFSKEERAYLKDLRAALGSNDNKKIVAVARLALKSGNPEIKSRAIDALGWVGEDALPELTEFLMDADEEVVQAAIDKWEEAIRECESEADIINNTMLGMMAIRDEAACDYLSMNLIKSGEASLAVEAIVELMACENTACHGPAKEAYEWITNKEWSGAAAAQEWIAAHPDL